MTDDITSVLLGGGPVALIIAAGYAIRWILEGIKVRRHRDGTEPPAVTDAATTNAMLLAALKEERAANNKKDERIDELEELNDQIQRDRYSERAKYEEVIADLKKRIQDLAHEVAEFEDRLKRDLPHTPN